MIWRYLSCKYGVGAVKVASEEVKWWHGGDFTLVGVSQLWVSEVLVV